MMCQCLIINCFWTSGNRTIVGRFSPRFYDVVKEKGENLEIVFVSADKSPAEFQVSQKVQGGVGCHENMQFLHFQIAKGLVIKMLHVAKLNLACLAWYPLSCC